MTFCPDYLTCFKCGAKMSREPGIIYIHPNNGCDNSDKTYIGGSSVIMDEESKQMNTDNVGYDSPPTLR